MGLKEFFCGQAVRQGKKQPGMEIEIILIRHGETLYNLDKRIQGSLDSDLTEKGREQAKLLGSYLGNLLRGKTVHRVISSPQPRAIKTMQLILDRTNHPDMTSFQTDDRIQEVRCGDAEGKTREELDPEMLRRLRTEPDFKYPGGESINQLMVRSDNFLKDLERDLTEMTGSGDEIYRAVIVSHGHLNRAFAAVLTGLDGSFALRILQDNTGFSIFRGPSPVGNYRMVSWNETPHLRSFPWPSNI